MKLGFKCRRVIIAVSMMAAVLSFTWKAEAQTSISSSLGVIVYPSKGQSAKQQSGDEGECYTWARQQTGIDPVAVASAPTKEQGPAVGSGTRVRGAARGAAGGAAIGAIAGNAGKGAGIGAVVGTMAGGQQARRNQAAQEKQAQQSKAATLQHFNKAFGVCMEGRGYSVK
jgi:YMGG-like Gly-zipper